MKGKRLRWQSLLRELEFDSVKVWLARPASRGAKVLEVGGGDGYLAKKLAEMGFDVVSIDPEPREPACFPVAKGDSMRLEFPDGQFDLIFSSNVLEHIEDLATALQEMKRVLKAGGAMVHTVPTQYTTIYTLITQPVGYVCKLLTMAGLALRLALRKLGFRGKPGVASRGEGGAGREPDLNRGTIRQGLTMVNPLRLFIPWPHGTSSSCFRELGDWRTENWRKRFEEAGLMVKDIISPPTAYSRHAVFPFRFMGLRRWLARRHMNTCVSFLLER